MVARQVANEIFGTRLVMHMTWKAGGGNTKEDDRTKSTELLTKALFTAHKKFISVRFRALPWALPFSFGC